MITDITPWKAELKRLGESIVTLIGDYQHSATMEELEAVNFQLEKSLFYSAIAIRRVLEAHEWTVKSNPNSTEIKARCLPNALLSKNLRLTSKTETGEQSETLSYKRVVDEILHSADLRWHEDDREFLGFHIASDHNLDKRLLFLKWSDFLKLLRDFYAAPERNQ